MANLLVAVGTTRGPKLAAVREALAAVGPLLDDQASSFDIAAVEVPSGVGHTPLSREEIMAGARGRAEALQQIAREHAKPWKYFIGLEGGLDVIHEGGARWVFLQNWAYVSDAGGRGAFGQGGAVLLPEALAHRVVDEGIELAHAIDAFAGGRGIRDAQGAWGVLTRDLITRRDAFRTAIINAFTPFLNPGLYRATSPSKS